MFDAAILCGGKASRLGELTASLPKSLIDINGKPFIYHQLKLLEKSGFTHVVLCVGHLGAMITDYVKTIDVDMKIDFSDEGDVVLGTGGAIKKALPLLNSRFFVIYGDSYLPVKYVKIEGAFTKSKKLSLMTIYRNKNKKHGNNILLENNTIVAYDKAKMLPEMHHIDFGIGCFHKIVFQRMKGFVFGLDDVYKEMIKHRQLANFEVDNQFYEIGSLEGIEEFRQYIKDKNK